MVASRRAEELVDPLIEVQPAPRALKRTLLVCLRCIDLDSCKRPKMGQIVHMLEADDFPFRTVSPPMLTISCHHFHQNCLMCKLYLIPWCDIQLMLLVIEFASSVLLT